MKADIHPDYRKVLFHDTAADVFFLIGSTVDTEGRLAGFNKRFATFGSGAKKEE